MTKVLVTEDYLGDIADAIREKNGSTDTYTPGQMAAAIASIPTGGITPTGTVNITQNGTNDVTQYASANVNVQPNLQSKTVTQNGTVTPDQGYDGLSSVVVNVSGGGASNVIFGDGAPDSSIGVDGDYYIRSGASETYIRIDITKVARGATTDFTYYGSRAISIVCKDESENEVEISPYIVNQYYWTGSSLKPQGTNRGVFRATIGNYIENNGLPAHYAAHYTIPSDYKIYKIKLTRRDSNSCHDFWSSFNIYQCDAEGNNLSLLLSESDLTEADWNDWDSFTEFFPTGQLVYNAVHQVYEKQNGLWVII